MKNKIINTLNYTGIVTLSQYIGAKKVKVATLQNAGGSLLFDFLYDCLTGSYNRVKRPTKIMVMRKTAQTEDNASNSYMPASGFVFLRSVPEKDMTNKPGCVRFSFVLPRDLFDNLRESENETYYLGLFAHNTVWENIDDYMAICELDFELSKLQNASLVVDWELFITNKNSDVSITTSKSKV